ncbi:K02A2.6-like [Cordylochernes scorpioides]|uniref:K02A2.6-like n=1 Tax=Cordylochernes scorpioides TaxID=51811 RepID=A0ABY6KML3_9ARAC|nr:K02A2.6-like [Cordylochernes scorpioides]
MLVWGLLVFYSATVLSQPVHTPHVYTYFGEIRGTFVQTRKVTVAAFLGIPYAKPPLGDLRFRRPIVIYPWFGVRNATDFPPSCMQFPGTTRGNWIPRNRTVSEDCLYLNIWVPVTTDYSLKTVMVWLDGGDFTYGGSINEFYNGVNISARGDVIVVSVNYRHGLFGFLTSGTGDAPGNVGLHDQNLALRWVKDNIKYFGGDPEKVTIFGQGAGAISVGLHLVSPLSWGLFRRAILQSGAAYQPFSAEPRDVGVFKANQYAFLVGCANDTYNIRTNPAQVVECLRQQDANDLAEAEFRLRDRTIFFFRPVWGDDILPESPIHAMDAGRFHPVDVLLSATRDEGSVFIKYAITDRDVNAREPPNINSTQARNYTETFFRNFAMNFTKDIADYYLKDIAANDSRALVKAIYNAMGDYFITCPLVYTAEIYAKTYASVYFHYMTYRNFNSRWPEWYGTAHFDEVPFVFGLPLRDRNNYTDPERQLAVNILVSWVTFAKYGSIYGLLYFQNVYTRGKLFHFSIYKYVSENCLVTYTHRCCTKFEESLEKDTEEKKMAENPNNRLQKFNGSKSAIRPESWIKLYDFENNSLKEDEKIKNLMYYLTDSALEWYADEIISNPAIKRWEVVKEKLIQRFGSYNANPIVSASHRRLKREESIENYFQDKIRLLNQTHLTKEEKIHLLTDGLPNDWKDLIVAAQPTDTTKWFHIAASIEQNRASIQFKPKNKILLATKNNDNRKNVCPFWCPICSKKGIKIKHWVTDCEDYDPNYKKDRPNQNTSVKQVCGAPELLNVSTLTNTPTQGAFKLINISVEVNGIPAQAFVDTGATVSIINWRLFKRTRLQLQPNSDIHISQADGVTRTCGSLQTKVRIDKLIKPVTLHVMKNFKYPLLIGLDVASLFNLLIDVRDKTIYTKFDGLQNPILVNHLEDIREHELKELLEHNRNVFSQHAIDLGKVAIQHKIITKSEQPISLRPYRRPLKEYEEIAEQVKELLEHKLIRISDSPWAFPVVMVPKKDGNKRMCIDYRRLNEITLDDRQPLPHIQDMFDRLHGSRFFSTLDVAWGYWQIEMDPQSIQKTAFVTNDGHYEFLVMPFGLKNAASTFQRIIQHILGELLWKGTCSFQDDILVYTKTWQEHMELLSKVFDKLRQYNMKLKLSKCIFGRTEVKYLGHIISHNQLKPDPGKVKSIQDFPRPDTVKKVRQFMGLANYYRKFVKDFSKISFPLVRLTRKNQPFIWNEEVEESFAKLKMALSTKPVLAIYNPDYPSKVYTDASKYGIGAILTQIGPDNEEHVIAYYSKTLQPHQENYSAYEMECLAVIQATDHFHVYIENQPFEIITDHAALQWLFTMKKPKPKYFRWILSLSSKSCNIVHRSGKQQTHVDALSRLPVVNIATQELQEHQQNSDLSFLKNSHTHDGVVMIKQRGVFKAVVPNSLTKKILEEYHDSLSHPSITKTCKLITQCYWWKGITTDIKNYVRSCKSCQLVKVRHEPTLGEMITPTSNIQPLQMIGCDTIVLGTAAANTKHKFIQVFVDHATRYLWAYPTITNTAQAVTQCLDKIIKSVNSINTILTDNGKNFISKEFNKFLSLQGIKHTYTSPYHPQCNGICEKLNDTIMTKLRIAVLEKPRCKWSSLLPQVVKNYNSTPHDVTGFSPLFLMYGIGNVPEFADQTPITIEEARKKASLRTEQFRSKWKIKHDSHHPKYVFKEGDFVIRKIAFNDPRLIKTSPKYEGPFVIQKRISDVTYDISLKDQKQARRVHISQLRPFITRE